MAHSRATNRPDGLPGPPVSQLMGGTSLRPSQRQSKPQLCHRLQHFQPFKVSHVFHTQAPVSCIYVHKLSVLFCVASLCILLSFTLFPFTFLLLFCFSLTFTPSLHLSPSLSHPLPPTSSCEAGDLAGRLGPLPANGQLDAMDTTGNIDLDGFYSIVGRSVVIHQVGTNVNFECGSIISQQELDGQFQSFEKFSDFTYRLPC